MPEDWHQVIAYGKKIKKIKMIEVTQLTSVDFLFTSKLFRSIVTNRKENTKINKVQSLKVLYLLYEKKNSFVMSYKYWHSEEHNCQKLDLRKTNYN